jgi:hypothetical protein
MTISNILSQVSMINHRIHIVTSLIRYLGCLSEPLFDPAKDLWLRSMHDDGTESRCGNNRAGLGDMVGYSKSKKIIRREQSLKHVMYISSAALNRPCHVVSMQETQTMISVNSTPTTRVADYSTPNTIYTITIGMNQSQEESSKIIGTHKEKIRTRTGTGTKFKIQRICMDAQNTEKITPTKTPNDTLCSLH